MRFGYESNGLDARHFSQRCVMSNMRKPDPENVLRRIGNGVARIGFLTNANPFGCIIEHLIGCTTRLLHI